MIHQCYYEESQRQRLFTSPLYRGFGLYAEVNPDIARNCPELENPSYVRQLNEYGAMLHHWRNPELDPDPWIGFTSYRQLDKFDIVFDDRQVIERHLAEADVIGFGWYECYDVLTDQALALADQGERCHPGLNGALWRLLMLHNDVMPATYLSATKGLFCNYWIMSKDNFNEYMEWSVPLVRYALDHPDSFAQNTRRALGYIGERLVICWYGIKNKRAIEATPAKRVGAPNRLYRAHLEPNTDEAQAKDVVVPDWRATLDELCRRHRLTPKGIIHIGAHHGEERAIYDRLGVAHVLWVEADGSHLPELRTNLADFSGQRAVQACLIDRDGAMTPFYRTSNGGQSSSVLPLGTHRKHYPTIQANEVIQLETTTFQALAKRESIRLADFDILVLHVQGAELLVLKGFGDLLSHFGGIYVAVNRGQVYEGCAQMDDIDAYLQNFAFRRRETLLNTRDQGDALYLREGSYVPPPPNLAQVRKAASDRLMDVRTFELQEASADPYVVELLPRAELAAPGPKPRWWNVRAAGHEVVLEFISPTGRTASLLPQGNDIWRGRWLVGPDDEIVLRPRVRNKPRPAEPGPGELA